MDSTYPHPFTQQGHFDAGSIAGFESFMRAAQKIKTKDWASLDRQFATMSSGKVKRTDHFTQGWQDGVALGYRLVLDRWLTT